VGLKYQVDESLVNSIAKLSGVVSANKKDDKTISIGFSGGLEVQERLLGDLVRLKIGVISYKPSVSDLEDAYLKLIKATL
jgi:hypothetical protein